MISQAIPQTDDFHDSSQYGPISGRSRVSIDGLSGASSAKGKWLHSTPSTAPSSGAKSRSANSKATLADALKRGHLLLEQRQFAAALECFEEALQIAPADSETALAAAKCAWEMKQFPVARQILEVAVKEDPSNAHVHLALGQLYLQDGLIESALESSERAVALLPDHESTITLRATVLQFSGDSAGAWTLIDQVIGRGYRSPQFVAFYAELAFRNGRADHARLLLDEMLSVPGLKRGQQALLRFAAAGLLDQMKQYDDAFAEATRANQLRQPAYDEAGHEREITKLIAYFTRRRLRCLPKASYRDARPVFVVGMPRSGTSLTEQILASHPDVHGAGELDFLSRVFHGTLDMLSSTVAEYPACLDRLSVDRADGMAQIYLEPLKALNPEASRIVDKMPLNFLHVGLIALLLPEAKIIHCRRDPLDTCLSCYLTDFSVGNDFKYDLSHLGSFYRLHDRLMAHWKSVLDIPILDVTYEKVVANPEAEARRMIDFIGLPWNERCLDFHETQRPCVTASVEQVRKPIYNTSVQRWRHYSHHLGPLQAALRGG